MHVCDGGNCLGTEIARCWNVWDFGLVISVIVQYLGGGGGVESAETLGIDLFESSI